MPDDHSEVVPLLPIPNRTVKRLCADDSADSRVKVGHRQALTAQKAQQKCWAFCFLRQRYARCALSSREMVCAASSKGGSMASCISLALVRLAWPLMFRAATVPPLRLVRGAAIEI